MQAAGKEKVRLFLNESAFGYKAIACGAEDLGADGVSGKAVDFDQGGGFGGRNVAGQARVEGDGSAFRDDDMKTIAEERFEAAVKCGCGDQRGQQRIIPRDENALDHAILVAAYADVCAVEPGGAVPGCQIAAESKRAARGGVFEFAVTGRAGHCEDGCARAGDFFVKGGTVLKRRNHGEPPGGIGRLRGKARKSCA